MRANNRTRYPRVQKSDPVARLFAEQAAKRSARLLREVGTPGSLDDGLTLPSYNPEMSGREWFAKVDEMVTASSQAAVVELCVCLPIVSTEWTIDGGARELRELCETSLFGAQGMSTTWADVLYQAAMSALYGLSVFELVYKEVDGALLWRRCIDRDPRTIERFEFDADGGLAAVVQQGDDPDSGQSAEFVVPIDKVLLFPYRMRRREYWGRSILRPAWRHYASIDVVTRIADIGIEHSMVGLPVGRAPQNYKEVDFEKFRAILAALRRHERAGLVLPPGWDLVDGAKLGGRDQVGFLDYLQWHEGAFLRAALCGFMQLGSTATGTTELGGALMKFATMAWGGLAQMIEGVFNRHGLRRLCDLNASVTREEDYPRLVHRPVRELFAQPEQTDAFLREVASGQAALPEDPEARAEAVKAGLRVTGNKVDARGAAGPSQAGSPASAAAGGAAPARRRAGSQRFAEADPIRHAQEVGADQQASLDAWGEVTLPVLRRMLGELVADAGRFPSLGAAAVAAVKADPETVAHLAVKIGDWLTLAYDLAWQRMAAATGAAARPSETTYGRLRARARVVAEDLAAVAEREVRLAALDGASPEVMTARFEEALGARLASALQAAGQAAAKLVGEQIEQAL